MHSVLCCAQCALRHAEEQYTAVRAALAADLELALGFLHAAAVCTWSQAIIDARWVCNKVGSEHLAIPYGRWDDSGGFESFCHLLLGFDRSFLQRHPLLCLCITQLSPNAAPRFKPRFKPPPKKPWLKPRFERTVLNPGFKPPCFCSGT